MLSISLEYDLSSIEILKCRQDFSYDEKLDDIRSLIMDVCDFLSDIPTVKFRVSGFGQSEWPVDVWVDLSTIIPQIPDVLVSLNESKDATLHFFEQGVERMLYFHCQGYVVEVTCKDLVAKVDYPVKEVMPLSELKKMLTEFLRCFIHLATMTCPNIVNHEIFRVWLKDIALLTNI